MLVFICSRAVILVCHLAVALISSSSKALNFPSLQSSFLRVFLSSPSAPLLARIVPFYAPFVTLSVSTQSKAKLKTESSYLPHYAVSTQTNQPIIKPRTRIPAMVVQELLQPVNSTSGISKLGPIVAPQSMLHAPTLAPESERDSGAEQRANAILHSLPAPWTMPIPKLCEVIFESTRPYEAWIDSITCYREPKGVRHEFLVVKIALSDGRYRWIRLDRAVQNSTNIFRLFSQSSRASAQDEATIHSTYSADIVRDGEVVQHLDVRVHLLSLHILADLLKIFSSEAEFYTLFQEV
ncbi:hypothetical protein FRC07_003819 [Ceratobasidium sp. 392]|nr:hypothetical protein FRC07_003819 [Ceratobasidium sp. 392]